MTAAIASQARSAVPEGKAASLRSSRKMATTVMKEIARVAGRPSTRFAARFFQRGRWSTVVASKTEALLFRLGEEEETEEEEEEYEEEEESLRRRREREEEVGAFPFPFPFPFPEAPAEATTYGEVENEEADEATEEDS